MAHLIEKPQPPAEKGADDAAILFPDRTIRIAGRDVLVREYGFVEGMKIKAQVSEVVDALEQVAMSQAISFDAVEGILDQKPELLVALLSKSSGLTTAEIDGLNDVEGELLKVTWWAVNARFFVRRVARRVAARLPGARRDGATSSPPLSPTATTPSASAPTQGGS